MGARVVGLKSREKTGGRDWSMDGRLVILMILFP